jgi:AcrR family transcriptional regulator/DNA/RNA-binding domain of Phe-tRNA-synthetase-like protein
MAEPARSQSRSERRKARTTTAIVDAAERHFLEHGFQAAKVDEIAEEADVAVGSVYNHFGSKEGLYRATLERALALFEDYMAAEPAPDAPALEQLLDLAGRVARFGRERQGHLRLLVLPQPREADEQLAEAVARVRKSMAAQERRAAALIEAAVRCGDARPLDSRRAGAFLWSAWTGTLALAGERGDRELRAVLEAGLRIVVGGVASERSREQDGMVRALLDTAPATRPPAEEPPPREALKRGPVLGSLRAELPELALWTAELAARPGPSPQAVRARLEALGSRLTGAEAAGARRESTPWAYRVLARQLGVEEGTATPAEELALRPSEVTSCGLPEDALAIATLETGVPLLAFDAERLAGELALRRARDGEELGAEGSVVIADRDRPVAVLLGERAPGVAVTETTERITLAAVQAKGVGDLAVEEALWTAIEIMGEGR